MRKFIILLALMLGAGYVQAQGFGLEAGLNFGSMTESYDSDSYKFRNQLGFYIGANYEHEIGENIFLHGGLAFSQYGGIYTEDGFSYQFKINYLEFPLMIKYAFDFSDEAKGFIIAGPVLALALSGNMILSYGNESATEKLLFDGEVEYGHLKFMNTGLRLGGGVNIKNIEGGLYYTLGISDIEPGDARLKTNLFSIVIGYRFH